VRPKSGAVINSHLIVSVFPRAIYRLAISTNYGHALEVDVDAADAADAVTAVNDQLRAGVLEMPDGEIVRGAIVHLHVRALRGGR
jgi:hypothetical protein